MQVREKTTREYDGLGPDGKPMYSTVWHGVPADPESLEEWISLRVASLGAQARTPGGLVYTGLLQAGGDAKLRAAVAAGGKLTATVRYGVLLALKEARQKADAYSPAAPYMAKLVKAWIAKWGQAEPKPERQPPAVTGPGAGTGLVRRRA